MRVTVIRSTDPGAPPCDGLAGSLVTLFDYALVGILGWTKPFAGVSKGAYRTAAGNQYYLRVQDDGPGAFGAQIARARGFVAMTTVDAGTNGFPDVADPSNPVGDFIFKSPTADAVPRAWILIGDQRRFYFFAFSIDDTLGVVPNTWSGFYFGDLNPHIVGDVYATGICGRYIEDNFAGSEALGTINTLIQDGVPGFTAGHFMARLADQVTAGSAWSKIGNASLGNNNASGSAIGWPTPNLLPYVNFVYATELSLAGGFDVRGWLPGFWHFLPGASYFDTVAAFPDGSTFLSGIGTPAGKTWLILRQTYNQYGSFEVFCMEISDTWDFPYGYTPQPLLGPGRFGR